MRMGNGTENTFAYNRSTSGCKACCSWPTKTVSCKRRNNLPLTASFLACKECVEWLPSDYLLRHNHVFPQTSEAEFHISLYLCSELRTWAGCLPWLYSAKTIPLSQFIEITKVKTASISEFNLTFIFSTTKYCKLELFYLTLRHKREFRSHVFV